jgi:hypothetical protein
MYHKTIYIYIYIYHFAAFDTNYIIFFRNVEIFPPSNIFFFQRTKEIFWKEIKESLKKEKII